MIFHIFESLTLMVRIHLLTRIFHKQLFCRTGVSTPVPFFDLSFFDQKILQKKVIATLQIYTTTFLILLCNPDSSDRQRCHRVYFPKI
jgi:hypothetical protein